MKNALTLSMRTVILADHIHQLEMCYHTKVRSGLDLYDRTSIASSEQFCTEKYKVICCVTNSVFIWLDQADSFHQCYNLQHITLLLGRCKPLLASINLAGFKSYMLAYFMSKLACHDTYLLYSCLCVSTVKIQIYVDITIMTSNVSRLS